MNKLISNIAYIGLGSNKGNRISYIELAVSKIRSTPGITFIEASSIYETKPFGNLNQENFYNCVIKITVKSDHKELFRILKQIEKEAGRTESEKWGPREIDLDILLFNDLIFSDEIITLPHKGILERDFVMIPMVEIDPEIVHPVLNKKISMLLGKTESSNIIRKLPYQLNMEEKIDIER